MDISNPITCYHGTGKSGYTKKNDTYFDITTYDVGAESMKKRQGKKHRLPGSLGYGIYTFTTEKMAKLIAEKFHDDPIVLNIELNSIEDNTLDLNDADNQENFHEFRTLAYKTAESHFKNFNVGNEKQHVFDGIVIELYIRNIQNIYKGTKVIAVKLKTYTPFSKEIKSNYSYIPNGTELCLRDKQAIKKVSEGGETDAVKS